VIVLSGDVPLIRAQTLRDLATFHLRNRAAMTILTAKPADPTGYGRIVRKRGAEVAAIVEQRALKGRQEKIGEINSGIYAFRVTLRASSGTQDRQLSRRVLPHRRRRVAGQSSPARARFSCRRFRRSSGREHARRTRAPRCQPTSEKSRSTHGLRRHHLPSRNL